ncbi:DUF2075 domain-containing protein [Yinghuangia soli]|uniref:DUF2075 domain-containing protein n=1 Tax=Yinghuangia soli TaxID=2908204 RepID=A0AA41PVB7_9ACTN|nr:DUF2075 domain-containing protein [Yinghuangia soli]MCF2525861.1 DUF2075 domain-containing protein [Yinghuangia soli]
MLLLKLSADDLLALDARRRMVPHLAERWRYFRGSAASEHERTAWAESLVQLACDLVAADRGNVQMIVECSATVDGLPTSGGPQLIDVVLVGRHPESHGLSVQLVEMKRWSQAARVTPASAAEVFVPGIDGGKKHPTVQLQQNYDLFTGERGPLGGITFECGGFAYMHGMTDESVKPLVDLALPTGVCGRMYTQDGRKRLRSDFRSHFAPEGAASAAEALMARLNVRNTPLLDAMINARGEDTVFTLRGRQKLVAEDIMDAATVALGKAAQPSLVRDTAKAVFLVTGGAGTGKSAVGLQVKAELEAEGRTVRYASGSRAFNTAMQQHVGYGDTEFQRSFTYFSSFVTTPEPPLDVLLCDEAHRIRKFSTNWMGKRTGTEPQVDELINAARLTVFFLDESQTVRPDEVGTVRLIEEAAARHGTIPRRYNLREQFRCGGSDAYIRWVRAALGLSGEEPREWTPDGLMHVEVADSPEELESIIRSEALAGATARMVAGYCWPWNEPQGDERRLETDIRIGEWKRSWNAKGDNFCAGDAPPAKLWSVYDAGLDQIGCVYTAQGLEWDWCGVIIGDDMVRRDGRWEFRRGKDAKNPETGIRELLEPGSCDPSVRMGTLPDDEFARCVTHSYHVLMTRASRATVLYSTDEQTRAYLKELVGEIQIHGLRPTWANLPPEARVPHLPRPRRGRGKSRTGKKQGSGANQLFLF